MTVRRIATALALCLLAAIAGAEGPATHLAFPRLNGTFRDLAGEIAPVAAGGLTIELSSPANTLTIRDHALELEPLGGGVHRFRATVDLLGKADLVAVFAAAVPGRIEDQVLLPIQHLEIEGELEIERVAEGYDVTTRRLPDHVEIAMQSRLANQLLSLCDLASLFTGGECGGLTAAFDHARLPLPQPGETYRIDGAQLTPEERDLIDRYLATAAPAGAF